MIIDSHTHTGQIFYPVGKNRVSNLPADDLIAAMKKYSIDYALVSSIEGAEFDSDGQLAPPDKQNPQLESFHDLLSFIERINGGTHSSNFPSFYERRGAPSNRGGVVSRPSLKALLWIKPYTENPTPALEQFITRNRDHIAGFKMHPSLSRMKFTDDRFRPYLDMARKFEMPVQVHTENDGFSDLKYVAEIASVYQDTDFVIVHMGLNTNNEEGIRIVQAHQNIYGDTCEVKHKNVIRAIDECSSEKILFGTDAIVHGIDTYAGYLPLVDRIRTNFSLEQAENVLFRNCQRIFNLPLC